MNSGLSNEEKKRLSYERQNAVRNAWKEEKTRVSEGYGTRKWSSEEQKELISRGAVKGYEGHHMKSVSLYPEYAGNVNNIQFLNEEEHLYGAHAGNYHNLTNGYYDPETNTMNEFGDELGKLPVYDLDTYEKVETIDDVRSDYYKDADDNKNASIQENSKSIKDNHCNKDTNSSSDSENKMSAGNGISSGRR